MKALKVITLILVCIVLVLIELLLQARPKPWPMTENALSAEIVQVKGSPYLVVSGPPMNYVAQVQGIDLACDVVGRRFIVTRYRIQWHPFSRLIVNNQWPVVYPLSSLPRGKYDIVHEICGREVVITSVEVP